jgi:hypothetical protein
MTDLSHLTMFVSGMLAAGYTLAALYFLKFWRQTRDRLFAYFAAAFALLLLQRVALSLTQGSETDTFWFYVVRLLAFVLIGVAILEKNRAGD